MNIDTSTGQASLAQTIALQPLFAGLPPSIFTRLVDEARLITHEPGEVLIRENSANNQLFLIVDGEARVDSNGTVVGRLTTGDLAGEISSAGISPPIATVRADTELQTLSFPVSVITDIAGEDAAFARRLRKAAFRRISG